MTTTIYDVQAAYISLIETNVLDPNTQRQQNDGKWIFDHLPASTLGPNQYPRISVLQATGAQPVESHELGGSRERINARLEIQIRSLKNLKFNDTTSTEFINSLAVQVSDIIRSTTGRAELLTVGVFQPFLEEEKLDIVNDIVIKRLFYKNIMVR